MSSAVDRLLKLAIENNASEVRLSGGVAPMLRIGDQVRPLKTKPLTSDEVSAMAAAVMPAGADPASFQFSSAAGRCSGAVLDVSGTKVLVLRHSADEAPPGAADDESPLELDVADESLEAMAAAIAAGHAPSTPRVATGTIQIDKLLTAAV